MKKQEKKVDNSVDENIVSEEKSKEQTAEQQQQQQTAEQTSDDSKQDENQKAESEEVEVKEEDIIDPCAKLTEELAQCHDKYARLSAEFDNYRKRTLKEKMDLITGGSEKAVLAILPVVDDLERAVANIKDEAIKEGVDLILKKMMDSLKTLSVTKVDAIGKDLDVEVHNAIAKFPAQNEEDKGKIIDVVKNGYRLGDKVIRHAEVVVGE